MDDDDDPKMGDTVDKSFFMDSSDEENDEATFTQEVEKKEEDPLPSTSQMSPKCSESKMTKSPPSSPSRSSPEPICVICLGPVTNKAFANNCLHMFCFTCIVEWTKIKPECPLCKTSFAIILHNIRSSQHYDEYHISSNSRAPLRHMDSNYPFRYSFTIIPSRFRLSLPEPRIQIERISCGPRCLNPTFNIVVPYNPNRVPTPPDSDVDLPSTSTGTYQSDSNRISEHKNRIGKLILKRNSSNNCWENVGHSQFNNSNEISNSNPFEQPGPSTSFSRTLGGPSCSTEEFFTETIVDRDQNECPILQSEQTPEIVYLSSDDDFTDFTSTNEVTSMVQVTKIPPVIDISDGTVSSDDKDEIAFLNVKDHSSNMSEVDTSNLHIDYSLNNFDEMNKIEPTSGELVPSTSGSIENRIATFYEPKAKKKNEINNEHKKDLSWKKHSGPEPQKILTLKSASNNNVSHSESWSFMTEPKKRSAMVLDDSSTESCSESPQVSEMGSRRKKIKLGSGFTSFDQSDEKNDSIQHSSSHKRHKKKKKKKKKHKHRSHIYSSDSE